MVDLTQEQLTVIDAPTNAKLFLSGPAGCGKTTVGVERMLHLLEQGIPAEAILVLTPQRTLGAPYADALRQPSLAAGGQVSVLTVGGLARRMVDLFWPLAAEAANFAHPDRPPLFLTLETAQYYMAHLVRPLLDEGYFDSVTIDRNRLYSQIIDNLNKSAAVGFPHTQIGERLDAAWYGDPAQRRVYADAQDCANRFRQYCLEHNLLDFSLQLEIFAKILWNDETVRHYLTRTYRHLIYDNIEEDIPVAHDLLTEWSADFRSALFITDEGGGYRKFLGADPQSAERFRDLADEQATFTETFVQSEGIAALENLLAEAIALTPVPPPAPLCPPISELRNGGMKGGQERGAEGGVRAYDFLTSRFYPQMLDSITQETKRLLDEGLPPSEIVILAPYLSDALRFSLMTRLASAEIPVRSHRPSRSLRDEPASQALLTLACLAHPGWDIRPTRFDIAYAFMLALNADLVRAQLLAEIVYRQKDLRLSTFDEIKPEMQERITYVLGNRYSNLRDWILAYRQGEPLPLDHFLRKLFGEVLSQPGFGVHGNIDAARVAATLIESVRKFRIALEPATENLRGLKDLGGLVGLGREYIAMLQDGVIAAQYLEAWHTPETEAVLVAPATTFLMMNRPVTVQFWLDPGSGGWAERLFQPLTHPYVLSRSWTRDQVWSDADEVRASQEAMARLVSGLLRRCRERVYLGLAELGETGFEQRGELLRAFQKILTEAIARE
ncbi:MAG: UvrD-helicase domain-containing protein [Anaerolineales bacterium]|nr:UvrD-helicase domain-containing protein [Anaerolineales bacterium]